MSATGQVHPPVTLDMRGTSCPGIAADVDDWVKATGLTLRAVDEIGAGEFEFYIAR